MIRFRIADSLESRRLTGQVQWGQDCVTEKRRRKREAPRLLLLEIPAGLGALRRQCGSRPTSPPGDQRQRKQKAGCNGYYSQFHGDCPLPDWDLTGLAGQTRLSRAKVILGAYSCYGACTPRGNRRQR